MTTMQVPCFCFDNDGVTLCGKVIEYNPVTEQEVEITCPMCNGSLMRTINTEEQMENEKIEEETQPETQPEQREPTVVILAITSPGETVTDPELYAKLSVPYETVDVAQEKSNEFYKEVCALREKYNVPEFVIAYSVNVKNKDGQVVELQQVGYRGGKSTDNLIMRLVHKTRFGKAIVRMMDEFAHAMLD